MSSQNYGMLPQTKASVEHILKHYELYKKEGRNAPMIVGVSGCQGSGKTTLCDTLAHTLKQDYDLNVVQFSLDDLYLTFKEQKMLSNKFKDNILYQQRGQAGTHDLTLAKEIFKQLNNNQDTLIPIYDKSLHSGQGDRLDKSQWKFVKGPFDIILFEGWMVGFKPLVKIENSSSSLIGCSMKDAMVMNELLKPYQDNIYPYFDIFIHLSPKDIQQVYQWRLQQEHYMKSTRGVNGLSDNQVKKFVDTYMPAYQLYLPQLDQFGFFGRYDINHLLPFEGLKRLDGGYSQERRHLKIILDQDRRVISSDTIKEPIHLTPIKTNHNNLKLLYPFAFIGLLGLIGFKRHSIMKSIYSSWHSFKK